MPIELFIQSVATELKKQSTTAVRKRVHAKIMSANKAEVLFEAIEKQPASTKAVKQQVWQRLQDSMNYTSEGLFTIATDVWSDSTEVKKRLWQRVQSQLVPKAYAWLQVDRYKWGAALTAVAIIATISPRFAVAPPLLAEAEVLLSATRGEVTVYSNNLWSPIERDIVVEPGMRIRTHEGEATISMRDDAVLRLAPYTSIRITDTAEHIEQAPEVIPALFVDSGTVWLQGLVPTGLRGVTIATPHSQTTVHEGSVSLDVQELFTSIAVWDRSVQVQGSTNPQPLLVGQRLVVIPNAVTEPAAIVDVEFNNPWVRTNLSRDAVHRKYIAHVQHERLSAVAGTLPTSSLYPVKRLAERVDVLLTFNEEDRVKKQLGQASLRLSEAAALLTEGSNDAVVQESLTEYTAALNQILEESDDFQLSQMLIKQSITDSKAVTSAVKPDDDTYIIKKTVLLASSDLQDDSSVLGGDELTLVSDALNEIATDVQAGNLALLKEQWPNIHNSVQALAADGIELSHEHKEITKVLEGIADALQANPTLLREVDEKTAGQIAEFISEPEVAEVSVQYAAPEVFLTQVGVQRLATAVYNRVYSYQTQRGRKNTLRTEMDALMDEPEVGRILRAIKQNLPNGSHLRYDVQQRIDQVKAEL